jgi:hypothetical protein
MEKLLHGEHPVTLLRVGKNSLSLLAGWTRIYKITALLSSCVTSESNTLSIL